jgi:hypothetical protein
MSKVFADKIEPRDSSMDVTIGTSTNTVTLAGNDLRANTVKDSGGNTLWVSDGSGNLSSINSALAGNLKLLTTNTFTGSSSSSFTSLIDSTYDVYVFKFYDCNPATDDVNFVFNGSSDGGSNYNVTKTTTAMYSHHDEADSYSGFNYTTSADLAQSTAYQPLSGGIANDADASVVGEIYLFNPSGTTYVKHFSIYTSAYKNDSANNLTFYAGYFNTTSAINALDFKFASGVFDGEIKMYGLL